MNRKTALAALGAAALGVAAIGTPAAATDTSALARATALDMLARQASSEPQGLVAAGDGAAIHAAPWQVCGSAAAAGVGGVIDLEPDVVLGDCRNANVKLWQDTVPAVIGALGDTAIIAAPWQPCGSDVVAGVGGTVTVQAGKAVYGKCDNANVDINVPDGYGENGKASVVRNPSPARAALGRSATEPAAVLSQLADSEPQSLVSAVNGSAVIAAPWQVCGSAAVAGVGGTIPVQSAHTMYGDCRNSNVHIGQEDPVGVVSALDNTVVTAAAWQVCGSDVVAGVGGVINAGSPNIVYGNCDNANTIID